jgi:hypothetical protein
VIYKQCLQKVSRIIMAPNELKWKCNHCNAIMDKSNYTQFIEESDNDKNSNKAARVEYHSWRLLSG